MAWFRNELSMEEGNSDAVVTITFRAIKKDLKGWLQMIEIKEQAYGLGLCVQKVKISQGILYPDVSSCLTLTAILGDEFVGAHVAVMDPTGNNKNPSALIRDATIYFVKKRIESFMGKAATNNFVIGWVDAWPQDKFNKLVKGQFEKALSVNLFDAGEGTSADIKFLTNGTIAIDMKKDGKKSSTISNSWKSPKKDSLFTEL